MSQLYIEEYATNALGARGRVPAAQQPPLAVQKVDFSASEAKSAVFQPTTAFVRLHTDAACSFLFGVAPVASANNARLNANQTEYFGTVPGHKVSVVSNS